MEGKIIRGSGVFDPLFQFFERESWKSAPEEGLSRLKIALPIATNEAIYKNKTYSGEKYFADYILTVFDFGKQLFELFTDDMMEHLHKALLSYIKYSNNPNYKETLKELGWGTELIILKEPKSM